MSLRLLTGRKPICLLQTGFVRNVHSNQYCLHRRHDGWWAPDRLFSVTVSLKHHVPSPHRLTLHLKTVTFLQGAKNNLTFYRTPKFVKVKPQALSDLFHMYVIYKPFSSQMFGSSSVFWNKVTSLILSRRATSQLLFRRWVKMYFTKHTALTKWKYIVLNSCCVALTEPRWTRFIQSSSFFPMRHTESTPAVFPRVYPCLLISNNCAGWYIKSSSKPDK